jgi:hypothetical protein
MLPPLRARHAQRSAKLSFASDSNIEPMGFVATKKMKLLSGIPDGFALVFEFQSSTNKGNRLKICCPKFQRTRPADNKPLM